MKRMTIGLIPLLVLAFVIAAVGCGGEGLPTPTPTGTVVPTPTIAPTPSPSPILTPTPSPTPVPTPADSDGDGWDDDRELVAGTNPNSVDTDGDGYWDPQDPNPLDPNIPVAPTTGCTANNECGAGEYCAKYVGDCEGEGECQPKPAVCPDIWDPVCGCDDSTYGNECEAASAGVNVAYEGVCTTGCIANNECGAGEYCAKDVGDCEGEGECQPKPAVCPDIWDPVCGCDDSTYGNECEAAMAGVNVAYAGECTP